MKKLVVIFVALATFGCSGKVETKTIVKDSIVYMPCPDQTDTLYATPNHSGAFDSLKTELILAQFKLGKVKYYLNICLKNPSQDKFLKGWVKRAIQ